MARMIRKQFYIEPHQDEQLKKRARELGITEAELVRQCIDQMCRAPMPMPRDPAAWQEARSFILQRMQLSAPQTGRAWRREELYDERLGRIPH